ncbi:hypothetical protein ACLKMW_05450 [Pseudaminobacter sp. NGMCC 1.201702]
MMTLGLRLSASIAKQCGVASDGVWPATLLAETCSEVFRPSRGANSLVLARRPVSEIISVDENGAALSASDYEVSRGSGVLTRISADRPVSWPSGKITVVYKAGYDTAPGDLKLAASKLATALYSETARDPNLKRIDIPDVEEREYWVAPSDDPLLSAEISDLLAPYRQVFL